MEGEKVLTDIEYDIIDELYFVTSYADLKEESELSDEVLKKNLVTLIHQDFIRVYRDMDEELLPDEMDLESSYQSYYYLASKKGLFEHNTK